MSLSNQFATDKEAEVAGVWIEYGPNKDGSIPRFKLSRMSKANKKYTKALERATRPHRRSIELETMDDELAERIFMKVFAETILLEWENIPNSDVHNDPSQEGYANLSIENAMLLFSNLTELYDDLQEKGKKPSLFRDVALEKEAGN